MLMDKQQFMSHLKKKIMDIVDVLLQKQIKICNPVENNDLSYLHIACANEEATKDMANKVSSSHTYIIEIHYCL